VAPLFLTTTTQGKSSKFAPYAQKVGLTHLVQDEDVVSSACLTHIWSYETVVNVLQYSRSRTSLVVGSSVDRDEVVIGCSKGLPNAARVARLALLRPGFQPFLPLAQYRSQRDGWSTYS